MLVQEMHIDFDIKYQKINTNNFDTFLPQEKDWLFNVAQNRVLRKFTNPHLNRTRKGGEDNFNRYEVFKNLITKVNLPAYNQGQFVSSVLPHNFYYYRGASAKVFYNCNGISKNIISNIEYISSLPFPDDPNTTEKYLNLLIQRGDNLNTTPLYTDLYNIDDFDLNYGNSFSSNEEKFVIINHIIEQINLIDGIEVRWEYYGDLYKPNHFIFIFTGDIPDSTRISFGTPSSGNNVVMVRLVETSVNDSFADVQQSLILETIPLRLIESEDLYDTLQHPFAKTNHESPVSIMSNRKIEVYTNNTFVINSIELIYIRKPKLINLSLNQNCEIAESKHEIIVDTAVQLASAYTGSDVHKLIINENLINE